MNHRSCKGCKHSENDECSYDLEKCDYCFDWSVPDMIRKKYVYKPDKTPHYKCEGCHYQTHDEMEELFQAQTYRGGLMHSECVFCYCWLNKDELKKNWTKWRK